MGWSKVQGGFVALAKDGVNPAKIPEHYPIFYAAALQMQQKFGHFGGVTEIPRNDWPMLCLLADQAKQIATLELDAADQERRFEKLERKLAGVAAAVDGLEPEPQTSQPKIDGRTKEGKALKLELAGAGVE